jgi:hypothetical protein
MVHIPEAPVSLSALSGLPKHRLDTERASAADGDDSAVHLISQAIWPDREYSARNVPFTGQTTSRLKHDIASLRRSDKHIVALGCVRSQVLTQQSRQQRPDDISLVEDSPH